MLARFILDVWMSGNLDIDVRIQCPNMASFQLRRLVDRHPCRYLGWIGSGALHALICQGRPQLQFRAQLRFRAQGNGREESTVADTDTPPDPLTSDTWFDLSFDMTRTHPLSTRGESRGEGGIARGGSPSSSVSWPRLDWPPVAGKLDGPRWRHAWSCPGRLL